MYVCDGETNAFRSFLNLIASFQEDRQRSKQTTEETNYKKTCVQKCTKYKLANKNCCFFFS